MSTRIRVRIDDDGSVIARSIGDDLYSPPGRIRLDGLDGELVGLFERWLTLRQRIPEWSVDEIRSFGQLLHRCLFPSRDGVWQWIRERIVAGAKAPARLTLQFPTGRAGAYIAAIPWEYLHAPDPGGEFLSISRSVILSRWAPGNGAPHPPGALQSVTILPVVSDASPEGLGPVEADEVLATLAEIAEDARFRIAPAMQSPTLEELRSAVGKSPPDVVHYMGHGRFDDESGTGSLAFVSPGHDTYVWKSADAVANALCPDGSAPRLVVLHTCEGGRVDTSHRFAGLAPELIGRGVQCVIAMQYPIRNDTAQQFSRELYTQLAQGKQPDEAIQGCRAALRDTPRLIGLPVLYQSRTDALFDSGSRQ